MRSEIEIDSRDHEMISKKRDGAWKLKADIKQDQRLKADIESRDRNGDREMMTKAAVES